MQTVNRASLTSQLHRLRAGEMRLDAVVDSSLVFEVLLS